MVFLLSFSCWEVQHDIPRIRTNWEEGFCYRLWRDALRSSRRPRYLHRAHRRGCKERHYFDTAPLYFGQRSEQRIGEGLAELRRQGLPYYLSTKTFESTETAIRKEVEAQLRRLNIDVIDFYHIWCITSLSN